MKTTRMCSVLFMNLVLMLHCIQGTVIDKPECGPTKFYCPDNCQIAYKDNGCPHNCNCGSLKKCPLVTCPAREPACAVYTQLDGCQSCACRLPYVIMEKGNISKQNEGFEFVNLHTIIELRRRLRDEPDRDVEDSVKDFKVRKIIRAQLCTIDQMDIVDKCLSDAANFHAELQNKHKKGGVIVTLNPIIKNSAEDLRNMCKLYRNALTCMKQYVFTVCRSTHPTLAEIDSIYGYSCGPKQHIFLHHLDCLHKAHMESYRLAACEDSAHRALQFIESSSFDVEERQKQKCEALNWLMGCERATMLKRCSLEASTVNDESLLSASQYIAPECNADFQKNIFITDSAFNENFDDKINGRQGGNNEVNDNNTNGDEKSNIDIDKSNGILLEQEPLKCTKQQQEEIEENFKFLETDLRRRAKTYSVAHPTIYSYREEELQQRCLLYQRAYANITSMAKKNCIRRHSLYSTVYFALEYPCGHGTNDTFFSHFKCLKAVRKAKEVNSCEKRAERSLNDPSNDPCETYNILMQCMHDTIVKNCGNSGWESEYQYAAVLVKNTVPNCRVKRILRKAKL